MNIQKKAVNLTDTAIGIIILGIIVSIGATILISQRDSTLTNLPVVTTLNETITPTDTGVILTNSWVKGLIAINNATGGNVVPATNYSTSINPANGFMTITNISDNFPGNWNVSYNWYNTSQADWTIANKSALGLAEYGNWFKIIVIVSVASVILGLIFLGLGKSSDSVSGGSY